MVVGVLALCAGAALAVAVARDAAGMDARDLPVNEWFRAFGQDHVVPLRFAEGLSWIGSGARTGPIVLGVAVVLLALRQWRWAVYLLASAELGYVLSDVTKLTVARSRPPWTDFGPLASGTSFPSGHTFGGMTAWVAMGVVFWFLLPRAWSTVIGATCWAVGLLNGPSRLVVGAHWVTDVVGGWLLGGGWLLVVSGICLWRWGSIDRPGTDDGAGTGPDPGSSQYAPWDSNPEPAD